MQAYERNDFVQRTRWVPATGNKYLMTDLLRDQLGFKGFVVTDYTSINEMDTMVWLPTMLKQDFWL